MKKFTFFFLWPLLTIQASIFWTSPVIISDTNKSLSPNIAMDIQGNVVATWIDTDSGLATLKSKTKLFNQGWPTVSEILSDAGQNVNFSHLSIANDHVFAVWVAYAGNQIGINAKNKEILGAWPSTSDRLSNAANSTACQIAVDNTGDAIAIWQQSYNFNNNVIESKTKLSSMPWTSTANRLSDIALDSSDPQIAIAPNGNAIAVWRALNGSRNVIQFSKKSIGGNWSNAETISDSSVDSFEPQIAMDIFGNAVVIWTAFIQGINVIQSKSYSGGSWAAAIDTVSNSANHSLSAKIAADPNGNITAVWQYFDEDHYVIHANSRALSGSWNANPTLISDNQALSLDPQIAIDLNGNSIATWTTYTETSQTLQVNFKSLNGSWASAPITLSDPNKNAMNPRIAASGNGNVEIIWQSLSDQGSDIKAIAGTISNR